MAGTWIAPLCARTAGRAEDIYISSNSRSNRGVLYARREAKHSMTAKVQSPGVGSVDIPMPIKTRNPVKKRPKSAAALPELSIKSSGFAHLEQIQFGSGAIT